MDISVAQNIHSRCLALLYFANGVVLVLGKICGNLLRPWLNLEGITITGLNSIYHLVGDIVRANNQKRQPDLSVLCH